MPKPLVEQNVVVKGRKRSDKPLVEMEAAPVANGNGKAAPATGAWDPAQDPGATTSGSDEIELEGVGGTTAIKRITFDEQPGESQTMVKRESLGKEWTPKHPATIRDIHYQIDHMGGSRAPNYKRRSRAERFETVRRESTISQLRGHYCAVCGEFHAAHDYETKGGYVDHVKTSKRRVHYVGDEGGERRFNEHMVDQVIRGHKPRTVSRRTVTRRVTRDGQTTETKTVTQNGQSKTTKTVSPVTMTEKAPVAKAKAPVAKKAPAKKPVAKKVDVEREATSAVGSDQPACAALTKERNPCRNHARKGSKYCASHKGYRAT